MAIANYSTLRDELAAPYQSISDVRSSLSTSVGGGWYSHWKTGPSIGATPTAAVVPGRADAGALGQQNAAGVQRLGRMRVKTQNSCGLILVDRLSHQGGLSGVAAGAQTTNLPTAALTRQTSGVGVFLALEIYTTLGVTATTVTASYTNQAGAAGQTTQPAVIGATDNREVGRLIVLPLQLGDTGVRAVASVTLAATTGTAGNFGVTLFKPLQYFAAATGVSEMNFYDPITQLGGDMPVIDTDACLTWMLLGGNSASTGPAALKLTLIEE